jgi:NADPH:quinone reductase-like Zn-dependent oxidoreductase
MRTRVVNLKSQRNLMRSIRYSSYGEPSVLHIADAPVPKISDDEVLIRVLAASLNPFDWKLRSGMLQNFFDLDFPIIPGRDGCGELVALGKNVDAKRFAQGQLVSFISSRIQQGSLAEFAAVSANDNVVPVAGNLTPQESAALPLGGLSAWNALVETAQIKAGMRVLIHGGSGGVGSIAIQIGRHFGADVFATCSAANMASVEALGAQAIPYDRTDFTTVVSDLDLVFDTVGGEVHEASCKVLREGGQMVYLLARPFADLSGEYGIKDRQVTVLGETAGLHKVIELAAQGVIKPIVGHQLDFGEFKTAFELGESGRAGGKIVLSIDDD